MSNTTSGTPGNQRGALSLEEWRLQRGITFAELARLLGVTDTTAWAYCLPRDHERAIAPRKRLMEKIVEVTDGAVDLTTFFASPAKAAA